MSQTTKTYTVAGIVGALGLILGLWPQLTAVFDWIGNREWATAIVSAIAAAFFAGMLLPYVLPGQWPQGRTRFVSGLTCALVAAGSVLWTLPTTSAPFHAFVAGLAAPTVTQALMGLAYTLIPRLKPESLQP